MIKGKRKIPEPKTPYPKSTEKKGGGDGEVKVESNMCHQCNRNDRGQVVRCTKCNTRRYCVPCITKWYPNMAEEMFTEACPVCRRNCNCKGCLRKRPYNGLLGLPRNMIPVSEEEIIRYHIYVLQTLLPSLKSLNEEQIMEKEIEANIQGCSLSEVQLLKANCNYKERIYCDNCKTSIFDFHRNCSLCSYDLCVICCREFRNGQLQECEEVMISHYTEPTHCHLSGELGSASCSSKRKGRSAGTTDVKDQVRRAMMETEWTPGEDGSIPCPPETFGGCGQGVLELKHLMPDEQVSNLLARAEAMFEKFKLEEEEPVSSNTSCSCINSVDRSDHFNKSVKAASRENCVGNYLYSPSAKEIDLEDLKHFQSHWSVAEPVIVRNVLETSSGLSWEPLVLWRAFRDIKQLTLSDVTALKCLEWCEVEMKISDFFAGYREGRFDVRGWPQLLKLKDWPPPGLFRERLRRHHYEFISCLPFQEYTHPNGVFNTLANFPRLSSRPDLGPETYIAYRVAPELGRGDSVTKLHCHMTDVVNVLTHCESPILAHEQLRVIMKEKKQHFAQEPFGTVENGGALWDIFRRQDIPKVEEYLKENFREFRHSCVYPLDQVFHPIHDQEFYLTLEHKKRLKEEFGVEPWTFIQSLGDAVYIPAGCPHQVRNLKSCIKVAQHFVSVENVAECIRLTEDLRVLPRYHWAKEDKLEVKKRTIYALKETMRSLEYATSSQWQGTREAIAKILSSRRKRGHDSTSEN